MYHAMRYLDSIEVILAGSGDAILDQNDIILQAEGMKGRGDDAIIRPGSYLTRCW